MSFPEEDGEDRLERLAGISRTGYGIEHGDADIHSIADAAIRSIRSVHERCIHGALGCL